IQSVWVVVPRREPGSGFSFFRFFKNADDLFPGASVHELLLGTGVASLLTAGSACFHHTQHYRPSRVHGASRNRSLFLYPTRRTAKYLESGNSVLYWRRDEK